MQWINAQLQLALAHISESFPSSPNFRVVAATNYILCLENGVFQEEVYRMKDGKLWGVCSFSFNKRSLAVLFRLPLNNVYANSHFQQKLPGTPKCNNLANFASRMDALLNSWVTVVTN